MRVHRTATGGTHDIAGLAPDDDDVIDPVDEKEALA